MKIHDEEFEDLLVQAVTVDDEALSQEFSRLSADMAYWSRRYAKLEGELVRAKAKVKRAEALAYTFASDHVKTPEGKKPNIPYLESLVAQNSAVEEAYEELARVTEARTEAKGCVAAIGAKQDMLVQMGANHRQEVKAHLVD